MPHETPLISTIVVGLVLAFVLGALANRFRISPLVGYLLAGVLLGPFTPGYVADQKLANDLAEIGVILLMFGVGLHFTLDDLLSVRAIALQERRLVETERGRIAVGWLVVEDFVMILALVLLPSLAGILKGNHSAGLASLALPIL